MVRNRLQTRKKECKLSDNEILQNKNTFPNIDEYM